jgi:hypothetical protein
MCVLLFSLSDWEGINTYTTDCIVAVILGIYPILILFWGKILICLQYLNFTLFAKGFCVFVRSGLHFGHETDALLGTLSYGSRSLGNEWEDYDTSCV